MKRVLSMLLATFVVFSAMLAYATVPAFADDDDDDDEAALRLFVSLCIQPPFGPGLTAIEFPEDEDFFVQHGWAFFPWSTLPPAVQAAAQAPTSRFDLLVDGQPVGPDEVIFTVDVVNDVALKLFRTNFDDDDAEDTRVFTGIWSLDGFLVGGTPGQAVVFTQCDLTVDFVEFDDDDDDD